MDSLAHQALGPSSRELDSPCLSSIADDTVICLSFILPQLIPRGFEHSEIKQGKEGYH